jgi:hypothetical protein
MNIAPRVKALVSLTFLSLAFPTAVVYLCPHPVIAAAPQLPANQGTGFVGQWCAQGDSTKRCSISANGPFFSLTNEQGSTSSGHIQGMNQNILVADQWQFVQGTLSPDGSQINWSNGTYWAQCTNGGGGGGGGGRHRPNLQGTWYRGGNHSLACSIRQNKNNLTFTNETGQTAQGKFLGNKNVTANWGGTTINGTLVNNAGQINWDNGTIWSR